MMDDTRQMWPPKEQWERKAGQDNKQWVKRPDGHWFESTLIDEMPNQPEDVIACAACRCPKVNVGESASSSHGQSISIGMHSMPKPYTKFPRGIVQETELSVKWTNKRKVGIGSALLLVFCLVFAGGRASAPTPEGPSRAGSSAQLMEAMQTFEESLSLMDADIKVAEEFILALKADTNAWEGLDPMDVRPLAEKAYNVICAEEDDE